MKEFGYERELHAAERRVAEDRAELSRATSLWLQRRRETAVSGRGLLGAVAAGFVVGGLMRRRRPKPAASNAAGAAAVGAVAGGGMFTALLGLAASMLRSRYGDPWKIAAMLWQRQRQARMARAAAAGARPVPPTAAPYTASRARMPSRPGGGAGSVPP
ncbi:hypothetical protein dqs_1965 [Azoarcus olearius]|uniref:hypothetical protein n=1 Tax=Azoarcus sp. (strain BH72) TaxID=418699 RepID=UPI000806170A|nr:hypothetical protein [Azoarcus olearius]ANQ85003.1 hypothetical protein dqs_1965 [Azoarcus olearius]